MKKIAISGAGGFLGSYILEKSINSGFDKIVVITSNLKSIKAADLSDKVIAIDTQDFLRDGFKFGAETVFINCLFPTNADGSKMADGITKNFGMILKAKESGADAIINVSSQSVYDQKRTCAAKENDKPCTDSLYAVGKYCSEMYCNEVFKNIRHTNIRLASLIGVGYDQRIANRLIIQALKGEQINISGGMQRYGLLDVRDAADGLLSAALNTSINWREEYNLGTDQSINLLNLVELIAEVLKTHGINLVYSLNEGTDTRNSAIDPSLFMRDFDWSPMIPLKKSLEDIVKSKI